MYTRFVISVYNNRIGGVVVSVLASSVVDREFESRSGKARVCKICIFCFSAKLLTIRRKSIDWLSRNQNNVCEWSVVPVS